jgi:AraC-like DNA-binding protein
LTGRYGFSAFARGELSKNLWTFGFRSGFSDTISVNRFPELPLNMIGVWPPGSEMEYVTHSEEQWLIVQLPLERLCQVYSEIYQSDLALSRDGVQLLSVEPILFGEFKFEVESVFSLIKLHIRDGEAGRFGHVLSELVTRSLARVLGSSAHYAKPRGVPAGHFLALNELNRLINRYYRDPKNSRSLVSLAGVDPQVLQRAAMLAYGVSPGRWLKIARLNGAYRDLRLGISDSVRAARERWNFDDADQFSDEYHGLFGETPNRTHLRSRDSDNG